MSFIKRLDLFKNKFSSMNLDGFYITNLTNVRYLTGFTGSAGSLLILENEQYFFTDGRYIEHSKNQVKDCIIEITGSAHYNAIKSKLGSSDSKYTIQTYISKAKFGLNKWQNLQFDKPPSITIIHQASSKGLEFDVVFVMNLEGLYMAPGAEIDGFKKHVLI